MKADLAVAEELAPDRDRLRLVDVRREVAEAIIGPPLRGDRRPLVVLDLDDVAFALVLDRVCCSGC